MKKQTKVHNSLFNKGIILTIDEKLNKLTSKNLAPKKLDQANKQLRKLKSLPR